MRIGEVYGRYSQRVAICIFGECIDDVVIETTCNYM